MTKLGRAREFTAAAVHGAQAEAQKHALDDALDETLDESFPASDPPSWTLGNGTAAARQRGGLPPTGGGAGDAEPSTEATDEPPRSSDEPLHPLLVRDAQPPAAGR